MSSNQLAKVALAALDSCVNTQDETAVYHITCGVCSDMGIHARVDKVTVFLRVMELRAN